MASGSTVASNDQQPPGSAGKSDQTYTWNHEPALDGESPGSLESMIPRRWTFNASVAAGFQFDNNVSLQEDYNTESGIYVVQPTVGVNYGPMASGLSFGLQYSPSFEWYTKEGIDDTVNHALSASLNWDHGPLHIYANLAYTKAESADVDAGERIARDAATASLGLTYDYSDKTSFGLTYSTDILSPENEQYIGSNTQTVGLFADYKITGKTTLGLGGQYEFQEVESGSDSNAYRFLIRSTWAATSKLTLHAAIGPELREYTDADSSVEAYWTAGIDYNFLDTGKTTFTLDLYRNQRPSIALTNQAYTATGIAGTLSYSATAKLRLTASVGYEHASYTSTAEGVSADRSDDLFLFRPGITYAINRRTSLSAFYQWTLNESSGEGEASFERNMYGLMMVVSY